jgi:SAM-dependent methyltransferase
MPAAVDTKYYEVVKPSSFTERILIQARDQIYWDFLRRMQPSAESTIVDVGVSDVVSDGANVLERNYPYQSQITACAISDAPDFCSAFPLVKFQLIRPNCVLPFADASFDIATSNAVLEHVGSDNNQILFVHELCRVARKAFISVPNRYFPIEHHTGIPLLHYADGTFRLGCAALGKTDWSREANLILMTRKRLWNLVRGLDRSVALGYTGILAGPLSSNLYLAIR